MPKNAVSDWSTTAGSNSDVGGINIAEGCSPANVNDALREIMAQVATLYPDLPQLADAETITGAWTFSTGPNIASGVMLTLGDGDEFEIYHDAGTSFIRETGSGNLSVRADNLNFLTADGLATYLGCTNGGAVSLRYDNTTRLATTASGVTVTGAVNGDTIAGSMIASQAEAEAGTATDKAMTPLRTAQAIAALSDPSPTLATAQTTTSGTQKDFTGIPAGVDEIEVMFSGVSLSGSDNIRIQLGDSGGIETSGYVGGSSLTSSSVTFGAAFTAYVSAASRTVSGVVSLRRMTGNTWTCSIHLGANPGGGIVGGGAKTLSAELDRLRISTSGSDTFDAGSVNISYRGAD